MITVTSYFISNGKDRHEKHVQFHAELKNKSELKELREKLEADNGIHFVNGKKTKLLYLNFFETKQ